MKKLSGSQPERGCAVMSVSRRILYARRLNRYWNARGAGAPPATLDRLASNIDPALPRTLDRIEALDDAKPADPIFAQRLERELMRAATLSHRTSPYITSF